MRPFHSVMGRLGGKTIYGEKFVYIGVKEASLSDFLELVDAVVDEFGVSGEEVIVTVQDNHVCLKIPAGAEEEKAEDEKSSEHGNLTWYRHGSMEYAVDEDEDLLYLKVKSSAGVTAWSKKLPLSKVKQMFDMLPERSTSGDVIKAAKDAGLDIPPQYSTILMRVLGNYVAFDAELVKEGRKYVLVKNDFSLRSEFQKKMMLEQDVIGKPDV